MSIDFTRKPTLSGELVTLRPADGSDAAVLHALMSDPEVSRLTGSVHSTAEVDQMPWTVPQLAQIYDSWATAPDRIVWVIVERSSGAVVGECVLNGLDVPNRRCGFRIWISGVRGRGLGTEATRLTLTHAFAEQGLNRVELEVYAFNPGARHVYEKVGFVLEGTQRQALRFDDGWVDAHSMAILARDWRG